MHLAISTSISPATNITPGWGDNEKSWMNRNQTENVTTKRRICLPKADLCAEPNVRRDKMRLVNKAANTSPYFKGIRLLHDRDYRKWPVDLLRDLFSQCRIKYFRREIKLELDQIQCITSPLTVVLKTAKNFRVDGDLPTTFNHFV